MQAYYLSYLDEVKYSKQRLFILFLITFVTILLWKQAINIDNISEKIFYADVLLIILSIISLIHYFFLLHYPYTFRIFRKTFLLLLDITTLTFVIALFQYYGLFLFPLYIIINMQTGLYFGMQYFYISMIATTFSWIALFLYSTYWSEHYDIIATFAVTTFLISLLYLNYIIKAYEEKNALSEELSNITEHANYDNLTGIANRRTYTEEIKKMFKEKESFVLMFIDLNKFKMINDNYGHHIGDEVLKEVAKRLYSQLDEDDFLARVGGDEFVIISKKKKVFLPKFIQKIEDNVIGYHEIEGKKIHIELSIGISMYPDDAKSAQLLCKCADMAMYKAKKHHQNNHIFYKDIIENKMVE